MIVTAPDGAKFRYDAEAGALQVSGIKSATIEASVKVLLKTPLVECTEMLKTKNFTVTEGGKMQGTLRTLAVRSSQTVSRLMIMVMVPCSVAEAGRRARNDGALYRDES
jgi:phage baseplate assembly protein V